MLKTISASVPPEAPCDAVEIVVVPPEAALAGPGRQDAKPRSALMNCFLTAASFILAWLGVGLLWEVLVAKGALNGRILVPPSEFLPYMVQGQAAAGIGLNKVTFGSAITATLIRVFSGFLLAMIVALSTAIVICAVRPFRLAFLPIARTIAPVAPVAWIPLAISVVGLGSGAAVFVVFMGIVGSVTVAAVAALDDVPDEYRKVARLLGARGTRFWLWVIVPAAAPALVTTMRMSFFGAWMAVLAGEMAGISSGLGALVLLGQQQFNMKLVMSGIIVIGILGFCVDQVLALIGRRLVWWESRQGRWKAPR